MGRLLGVVGVSGAMMLKIMALPPIVAITSLFVMRILVLGS